MNDIKFAFHQLLKNPGFIVIGTVAAILLLQASAGAADADRHPVTSDSPPLSIGRTNMVSREEPGDRLVLHGTVFEVDGKTPVTNAVLRIYQTDASGVYSRESGDASDERNPRLQVRLQTDSNGRYEVHTIMPGRYPGGKTPAHIHVMVSAPGSAEQNATFSFSGDPALTAEDYERHGQDGTFSSIRPAKRDADGVLRCQRDIRFRRESLRRPESTNP